MSSLRGRGRNLEIAVDRELPEAAAELRGQFADRPEEALPLPQNR